MRNRILAVTRRQIPYCLDLNSITGNMVSSILMQQMDFWFAKRPNGFYKFLNKSDHELYRKGDSWCEEIGITIDMFRTAFDTIGHRWASKTQFDAAPDKFKGKLYASYVDKRNNMTWYFRNHEVVDYLLDKLSEWTADDMALDELTPRMRQVIDFKADGESQSPGNGESQSPGNGKSPSLEMGKVHLPNTEKTTETTTTKDGAFKSQEMHYGSSSSLTIAANSIAKRGSQLPPRSDLDGLIYPAVSHEEQEAIKALIADCPANFRQLVLDETEGQRTKGFRSTAIAFTRALVLAVEQETFRPNLAIGIARDRAKREKANLSARAVASPSIEVPEVSEGILRTLPAGVRQRHQQAMEKRQQHLRRSETEAVPHDPSFNPPA